MAILWLCKNFKILILHRAFTFKRMFPNSRVLHFVEWDSTEISFLSNYFNKNCYPLHIFPNLTKKFLDNIFQPKVPSFDVPKKIVHVSLPYIGNQTSIIKKNLESSLSILYPYVQFRFIFKNPLTIGSLFRFKDTLPELMRSRVIYRYVCSKCNFGTYIGCTNRLLKVRIDSHRGVSHRTGISLNKMENSAVREHSFKCKCTVQYKNFEILAQSQNRLSLLFFF